MPSRKRAKAAAAPPPAGRAAGRAAAPTTPGAAATAQSDEDENGSEEEDEHFDENSNASEHDTCDEDDSDGDDVYEAGEIMDSRNGDGGLSMSVASSRGESEAPAIASGASRPRMSKLCLWWPGSGLIAENSPNISVRRSAD